MRLYEIVTEGSGIRYDNMGRPYFDRIEDYKRALKSDTGFIRKAAQDVMARGGQEGWPKQEPQVAQITMPIDNPPKTILDPNRSGLNVADIRRPEPIDAGTAVAGAGAEIEPKPTMPMGGIAGVIRRKKQK
ncbi:MAG: hypothetical protein CMD91_04135 [Gammaproteobacteria bacterium]|jgi:hypothetical protein|nr:hypothetical protein [Gammaproteobacteria bacterium]|tara:strand:+ start:105 stop:497 length:393 start_codon:yes stop_codon:yes gene_type:complete